MFMIVSKNILSALLFVTIMISLLGTWIAISAIISQQEVPVTAGDRTLASGRVAVYVMPEPAKATGKVVLNLEDTVSK